MPESLQRHGMLTSVIVKQTTNESQPDTWSFPTLAQTTQLGGSDQLKEEPRYHFSLGARRAASIVYVHELMRLAEPMC